MCYGIGTTHWYVLWLVEAWYRTECSIPILTSSILMTLFESRFFPLGSVLSSNNSLFVFLSNSYVLSLVGGTRVPSDWPDGQSLARDYRYRLVLFYGSTCWLVAKDISDQSLLQLRTLSSVYGIWRIFLSVILPSASESLSSSRTKWWARHESTCYWMVPPSLHVYVAQLYVAIPCCHFAANVSIVIGPTWWTLSDAPGILGFSLFTSTFILVKWLDLSMVAATYHLRCQWISILTLLWVHPWKPSLFVG